MSKKRKRRKPEWAEAPDEMEVPAALPVLPLRDTVVFPGTVVPLAVSRPASLKMLEESLRSSHVIA